MASPLTRPFWFSYHNGQYTCGTELYFHSGRVHIAGGGEIKKKPQSRLHFVVNFILEYYSGIFWNIALERHFDEETDF